MPPVLRHSRLLAVLGVIATLLAAPFAADAAPSATVAAPTGSSAPGTPPDDAAGFTNPIADEAAENFADPTMIRGRDGYWYAYSTADPRFAGDEYRLIKIARSRDLVDWEYVGEVFTEETEPRYDGYGDDAVRMYWAPDIEYIDGRYVLYYSYVVNAGADRHWRAIGAATAPNPAGPWTDSGSYVTGPEQWEPRPGQQAWRNVIDPEVAATPDGGHILYYGSVLGGVRAVPLSEDGLTAVGERTQITSEYQYEAAHIVHRDGYYYLFLSIIGGCCAGPVSAYPVVVARSTDPLGPFVDRSGAPVLGRHGGGTPVQRPNGNRWLSVGHNTLATDATGQQWLITHGIDRYEPYLRGFANARHLVMSRLDWVDGWPVANAGRGLLDGPQPAPVTSAPIADAFEDGEALSDRWRDTQGWEIRHEQAGGYVHYDAEAADGDGASGTAVLRARGSLRGDVRVRGAVRLSDGAAGAAGLALFDHGTAGSVRIVLDRAENELAVEVRRGSRVDERTAADLPDDFDHTDWHELDVRVRDGRLYATVTHAGLDDPLAMLRADLPRDAAAGPVALVADGTSADLDDITAAPLAQPVTTTVPDPTVGDVLPGYDESFDDAPSAAWQWLRAPGAEIDDGDLAFPIQRAQLIDKRSGTTDDTASVLLRQPPDGDWVAETKVSVPYGDGYPLGLPQAGFVVHADDDHLIPLAYAALNRVRYVSFGREVPWPESSPQRVLWGDSRLGPTADTMWLRLRHHVDPGTGEHHYRAATSTDGRTWTWHGVRTLPAGPAPQVGLAAFGIDQDDAPTARFDYVRFYDGDVTS